MHVSIRHQIYLDLKYISDYINCTFEEEKERRQDRQVFLLDEISKFRQRLEENNDVAEAKLKKVTADYLVLRHNARVSAETLIRSKSETKQKINELHNSLKKVIEDNAEKMAKYTEILEIEFEAKVHAQRSRVMNLETDAEQKWSHIDQRKKRLLNTINDLKGQIKLVKKKYNSLQSRRRDELLTITSELKKWKEAVSDAEQRTFNKNISPTGQDDWPLENGNGLTKLSSKLLDLKKISKSL